MSDDIPQVLMEVASRVFETSAFMAVFPPEEADLPYDNAVKAASISFSGLEAGRLILALSPEILPSLVASMLGIEEAEDCEANGGEDALLEVLNIICGNVLTEIFGRDPIFDLQPPTLIEPNDAQAMLSSLPNEHRVAFAVENTRAELILRLANRPWARQLSNDE